MPRLVIESRQDDRDDERTIVRSRVAEPALTFDHVPGGREPILWVADAVAWSHGAGSQWAPYVERIVGPHARTLAVKRRTRLPNQRAGNRVHFPQRLP